MRKIEEIVEELYRRWLEVVERDKKINSVVAVARELGIEISEEDVVFDSATEKAHVTVDVGEVLSDEEYDKIWVIARWIVGEEYIVTNIELLITTESRSFGMAGSVREKAERVGIIYRGFKEIGEDIYRDVFEIYQSNGVTAYLVIENRKINLDR